MFRLKTKPAENMNVRDMLFGDLPLDYWSAIDCKNTPWDLFKEVKTYVAKGNTEAAIATLKKIINLPGLESRHYLQACYFLNEMEAIVPASSIKIYGVVVEVSMPKGHDTLAVYADHSARYYNYSGSVIIWEHADNSLDKLIDNIMEQAIGIVARIGLWKNAKPPAPGSGMARISFLTSNGLHFGEASQSALFKDAMAGKTMYAMLEVMQALINKGHPANAER